MEVPQKKGIMYVYKLATGNQIQVTDSPEKAKKKTTRRGIWHLKKSKTYRENDGKVGIFEGRKSPASNIEGQLEQNGSFINIEGRKSSASNTESKGGQVENYKIFDGRKSSVSHTERQDGNINIVEGRKSSASNMQGQGQGHDGNYKFFEGRKSCVSNIETQKIQNVNVKIFDGRKSSASNIERQGGQYGNIKILEGRKSVSHVEACDSLTVAKFLQVKVVLSDMPGFMQVHALRCARKTYDSLEKFSSKHMAYTMKKEFDKVYGPAWHCIVGSSFGSFVTHSTGSFLYFSIHNIYILIFKTKVQRALD